MESGRLWIAVWSYICCRFHINSCYSYFSNSYLYQVLYSTGFVISCCVVFYLHNCRNNMLRNRTVLIVMNVCLTSTFRYGNLVPIEYCPSRTNPTEGFRFFSGPFQTLIVNRFFKWSFQTLIVKCTHLLWECNFKRCRE